MVNSSLQLSVQQLRTILYSAGASAHASGGGFLGSLFGGSSGLLAFFAGLDGGGESGLLLLVGGGDDVGRHTCKRKLQAKLDINLFIWGSRVNPFEPS